MTTIPLSLLVQPVRPVRHTVLIGREVVRTVDTIPPRQAQTTESIAREAEAGLGT
jgi:hypothetical protein